MLLKVAVLAATLVSSLADPVTYVSPAPQQQRVQVQYRQPEYQQQAYQPAQQAYQEAQQTYEQPQQVQYQQPQQVYRAQPQQVYRAQPQRYVEAQGPVRGQQPEQLPEDYDPNPQYQFSFDVKDDQFTNYQNRKEQREGDKISGSYSVVDSDGFIRTVKYTADPLQGFKAEVTREPTDIVVKIPQPSPAPVPQLQHLPSRQPQQQYVQVPQQQVYSRAPQPSPAPSSGQPDLQAIVQQQLQAQGAAQQQFEAYDQQQAIGVLPPRPKGVKAGAIGFASSQPGAQPVIYQAYQQ